MRITLVLLATFALGVSQYSAADSFRPSADSAATTNAPRLSGSDAIGIALAEARRLQYDLSAFKTPKATFSQSSGRGEWSVWFWTKQRVLDGCFRILIDDSTGVPSSQACG
jgi:hypothetical protein